DVDHLDRAGVVLVVVAPLPAGHVDALVGDGDAARAEVGILGCRQTQLVDLLQLGQIGDVEGGDGGVGLRLAAPAAAPLVRGQVQHVAHAPRVVDAAGHLVVRQQRDLRRVARVDGLHAARLLPAAGTARVTLV